MWSPPSNHSKSTWWPWVVHFKSILNCCRTAMCSPFLQRLHHFIKKPDLVMHSLTNIVRPGSQSEVPDWIQRLCNRGGYPRQPGDKEPGCQFPAAWIKISLWNPCSWSLFLPFCKKSQLSGLALTQSRNGGELQNLDVAADPPFSKAQEHLCWGFQAGTTLQSELLNSFQVPLSMCY